MNVQTADAQTQKILQEAELRFRQVLEFDFKPQEIAAKLRERIIGQDDACEALAVHLRHHLLQTRQHFAQRHVLRGSWRPNELGSVLMLGPTGCGKTHLMRELTDLSSLTFHIEDCTGLTETGYVGRGLCDVAYAVVRSASAYHPLAETALVFFDEADKLRFRPDTNGKDITGEGVQRSLLALLDGTEIYFGTGDRGVRNCVWRTDALFTVLGGAFAGLDEIIARRVKPRKSHIGFGRELSAADQVCYQSDLFQEVVADDLIQYGFMPELVGRLRDFVVIHPLDGPALQSILLQPGSGPFAAYQKKAAAEGFSFELSEELVDKIVSHALASGQGARVLRRVMAQVTHRALFEVPSLSHTRGNPVVHLGTAALQDSSYEIVYGGSIQRIMPASTNVKCEAVIQAWMERESPAEPAVDDASSAESDQKANAESIVPEALTQDAGQIAVAIGDQIRAEGHEVEVAVEVCMWGSKLGISDGYGAATPAARVSLWVRSPDPNMPPPVLHGGCLRAYVRRANIESTHWRLLTGARSYGCKRRTDKHRWRRHVVYLALDHEAMPQFTSPKSGGDQE